MLPLLLPSVSRTSQWSEMDELVDPVEEMLILLFISTNTNNRLGEEQAASRGLTSNGGACRPGRDGVSFLVEEDVSSSGAHLGLWNRLGAAVIIAVPLTVHRVTAEGCRFGGRRAACLTGVKNVSLSSLSSLVVLRTCVMAAVHPSMVVADGIQIIQEVGGSQVWPSGLVPSGLQKGLLGAVVAVHHVWRHVQTRKRKVHKGGELVPALAHLSEALQVEDEDVRQSPQTHLHHALLQLLAVGAFPGIVWGKLQTKTHKEGIKNS